MADIRYPNDRLEWSVLSPTFKRHIRYVDSHGWVNYDNASFKGDCREVIQKATPKKSLSKAPKMISKIQPEMLNFNQVLLH